MDGGMYHFKMFVDESATLIEDRFYQLRLHARDRTHKAKFYRVCH